MKFSDYLCKHNVLQRDCWYKGRLWLFELSRVISKCLSHYSIKPNLGWKSINEYKKDEQNGELAFNLNANIWCFLISLFLSPSFLVWKDLPLFVCISGLSYEIANKYHTVKRFRWEQKTLRLNMIILFHFISFHSIQFNVQSCALFLWFNVVRLFLLESRILLSFVLFYLYSFLVQKNTFVPIIYLKYFIWNIMWQYYKSACIKD